MSKKERKSLGQKGYKHVQKNYNFEKFRKTWVDFMLEVHEKNGSWDNRKHEKLRWELTEL